MVWTGGVKRRGVKGGGARTGSGGSRWRRWLDGVTSSATRPPAWNRILGGLNLRIAVGHLGREGEREGKESTSEHGEGENDMEGRKTRKGNCKL